MRKRKDMFVEDVPVSCVAESYLTAETLHEVERLKLHKKNSLFAAQ